ncbi:MAG TPA: hypothetical protein DCZ40_02570 [Lachnospiraceae bacterium]|nr:hypothetical protein [Lachnospiraceae bacterium]
MVAVFYFCQYSSPAENIFLKEPLKKRRHLVRFPTNLVPATLFVERERGDGGIYFRLGGLKPTHNKQPP